MTKSNRKMQRNELLATAKWISVKYWPNRAARRAQKTK